MYLLSIEQGFDLFRKALQKNDQISIILWQKTIRNIFINIIMNSHDKYGKNIDIMFNNIQNFLIKYNATDIFDDKTIKQLIEFRLQELECAETLLNFKDMVYKEVGYLAY